ncbi:Apoptosis-stimulating of p53 protein 1, partial [Orchesella cincta]
SGSADMVLLDRSELPLKSKQLFVKSGSAQPNSGNMGGQNMPSEKDSASNSNSNSTVRVSINRRIEMPPAFLFPESDPPPSDLVPEHQQSSTGYQNNDSQQHHQQQLLQLSPVSSASGDSVDASPLLMHKGPGINHQLVPEEYTLPDLFPSHPANNQNVFSSPSATSIHMTSSGSNKGDHFMNMNNKINSHMHRNAQALIESLGQQASETSQRTNMQVHQQHHAAVDENMINCEKGKRIDHNANSGNVMSSQVVDNLKATGNSGESMGLPHAGIQLESNEAVNENESCGGNINNNMIGGSNGNGSSVVGMDSRDHIPSEVETVTANKGEGNINNNPPGIGIAPAATTVPGVLRRVKKSNFKSNNKDHMPIGRRVSFDPLALLLDASLEGELDLVVKTAGEVGNVTPLHCAASCNNVSMVKFLVEHGACIFATTLSDHETAAEKCEEDEDGFGPCSEYLYSIQEKLGIMNGGVVYSVFDYDAQNSDELSFREGERLVILRKGDEYEREWWWASLTEKEGYVPRNLLGLYPRVMPQKRSDS